MKVDYDALYEQFDEYCAEKTDCKDCGDGTRCLIEFLKKLENDEIEYDTLTCYDKEEAMKAIDDIGMEFIEDWEFLDDGRVKLYLKESWWKNDKRRSNKRF